MINVEQAELLIKENINLSATEEISLSNAYNSILKEDIKADRNNPPFNRATMDGIAINFKSWLEGNRIFKIQTIQKAGEPQKKLIDNRNCLEIMTGAVVPENCDCVIKVEDIQIVDGYAQLDNTEISKMQNIHLEGSDYKKDQILIKENTKLN
ncbi:molybdopterin molybdenumtransferase MoeA, partial [bacterium]